MQSKNSVGIASVVVLAYFIILLSNSAKQMEERIGIEGYDTILDKAQVYLDEQYSGAWNALGDSVYKLDDYSRLVRLIIVDGKKLLKVYSYENESLLYDFTLPSGFSFSTAYNCITITGSINSSETIKVTIAYNGDPHIEVSCGERESFVSYDIEYVNDNYVANEEMEQALGVSTAYIVEFANEMRYDFETEIQKMHEYHIHKAKRNRDLLASAGFMVCALIAFIRNNKMKMSLKHLWCKRRNMCMGLVACFWTYTFRPIISQFILFWVNGEVNRYVAYAASAVIVGSLLCVVGVKRTDLYAKPETKRQMIFCIVPGIAICTILLRIGVAIASNFYFYEWKTYLLNVAAAGCAILLCEFIKSKYRIGKEKNEEE